MSPSPTRSIIARCAISTSPAPIPRAAPASRRPARPPPPRPRLNSCRGRLSDAGGAEPQGRSGQSTAGATHLIKVAVEAAIGKRSHVSVYGTDYSTSDGTGIRDYIHVSDLAAAHVDALAKLIANPSESYVMNCG